MIQNHDSKHTSAMVFDSTGWISLTPSSRRLRRGARKPCLIAHYWFKIFPTCSLSLNLLSCTDLRWNTRWLSYREESHWRRDESLRGFGTIRQTERKNKHPRRLPEVEQSIVKFIINTDQTDRWVTEQTQRQKEW